MAEYLGRDASAEVLIVVEQSGAAALTGDGKRPGNLDRDLDVERQRDRQGVETGPEVGRTGGNARDHGLTVCGARAWAE